MDTRLPALGLMALLAGCATGKGQQQEPVSRTEQVAQAQTRSQQALQQAQEAQQQATRQQREAEKARERVAKKEQELAKKQRELTKKQAELREVEQELAQARQRAQQERQQAIQAQRQAHQQTQRAQEIVAQSQQRALELQRNRVTVSGEVASIRADEIVIRDPGAQEEPLRLAVQEDTVVMKDGQSASLRELPLGTEVRATYQFIDGERVATRLEVSTPEQSRQRQSQ